MAANSSALVSVEQYLNTAYEVDCDYVDDQIEERNVGEGGMSRVIRRLRDFVAMGVPHVWIIDPADRVAMVLTEQGIRLQHDGLLVAPEISLSSDLAERFAALER
ncbi:MAG TPA: hypothetical protein VFL57_10685 [Bryobacteraceae bacterium]|nr:hypothetical protein [Bryobacteraceae bacterium]